MLMATRSPMPVRMAVDQRRRPRSALPVFGSVLAARAARARRLLVEERLLRGMIELRLCGNRSGHSSAARERL